MLRWWEIKTNSRRTASLVVTGVLGATVACGGNSSRPSQRTGGSAARSGAGGESASASGGAEGARGGGVGAGAGGAGGAGTAGDAGAGTSGAPMSGSAGVATAGTAGGGGIPMGGGAGSGGTSGTESSAGADQAGAGPCLDLCKPDAPACCTEPLRCLSGVPACQLDVLADRVDPQSMYADLVAKVAALSDDVAVSIGDAEIAKAAIDPEPAARIELELTAQASATHGPALKNLQNHPFRLSCDGQELYIGVVYIREGAAALRTPVLHVEDGGNDTLRLLLGSSEGAWTGLGGSRDPADNERLDRPELRAALCERGILSELEPPP